MKCIVSGSTGLVGKSLINILSKNNEVIALTRREYKFPENVKQLLVDYDDEFIVPKADHLFICLGYPLKLLELIKMNASVKQDFYKVDFELVYKIAKKAKKIGIENLSVVSAVGANQQSANYYLKIKGEMEKSLINLDFKNLNIYQPSHLLGERENPIDLSVKIFEGITKVTGNLLFGPLAKFKNVEADDIANLMAKNSYKKNKGVNYFNTMDV